jgi:hypothetical protein
MRGPPTADSIAAAAQRVYRRFAPDAVKRRLGIGGRPAHFYVWGFVPDSGKQITWGPMPVEEADAAARGLIEGEVFEMETIQLKVATSAIKAEMLARGKEFSKVLTRVSHKRLDE